MDFYILAPTDYLLNKQAIKHKSDRKWFEKHPS